ncbi:DUF1109 domain-containing protein [Pseudothioclava nitratireducens]|uniref:DUF1109 domain-containing protein n=1 Tax=Pseudothioclava nitratireducens TaxID=1928646 RepID=UPI0023DA6334|nr:DUF1109 domain-containing protein [Defluviimonas nitratireducens]MDF1621248.1 DUF1109 domain-containing protein [Defluviimonas nitratireducens]
MKTEDLIAALAQDTAPRPRPEGRLARAIGPAFLVAGVLMLALLGLRSDLGEALRDPMIWGKFVLPALVAGAALPLVLRLGRPAAATRFSLLALPAGFVLLLLVAGYVLTPEGGRQMAWAGKTLWPCLVSIPTLSLAILAATLWALRSGAVLRPALTGAMAGLFAGGLGTLIYATHCTEDSPLFYGSWYSLGMLITALIGALIAPRLLRW